MEQLEQRPFLCVNFSVFCSRGAVSRREAVRSQIQEKRKSFSLLLWSSLEQCEKKRKKFPILHWSGMEQFKEQRVSEKFFFAPMEQSGAVFFLVILTLFDFDDRFFFIGADDTCLFAIRSIIPHDT